MYTQVQQKKATPTFLSLMRNRCLTGMALLCLTVFPALPKAQKRKRNIPVLLILLTKKITILNGIVKGRRQKKQTLERL